jgi:hypothetical protein
LRRELALLKQSAWGHWRMSIRRRLIRIADRLHMGQGIRSIRNRIFGRWR